MITANSVVDESWLQPFLVRLKDIIVVRIPRSATTVAVLLVAGVGCYVTSSMVHAQSGKGKSKPPKAASTAEVKQIDARLEKLQTTFASESTAIIDSYERSGQYERAKMLLEVLLKLDPNNASFKEKHSELEKQVLKGSEFDIKFDAGSDWTAVGTVYKDKAAHIEATGEYKLNLSATSLTADGFPSDNVMRDLVGRVPTGALMGMVVTEEHQSGKQAPDVFAIKSKHDFTPKQGGTLYIKVNAPPGSKCLGDLKIKLSGITRAS